MIQALGDPNLTLAPRLAHMVNVAIRGERQRLYTNLVGHEDEYRSPHTRLQGLS